MISQALQNAQSIEEVVEIVNNGGTSSYSGSEIAGQYGYQAADENGYGMEKRDFEAQLDLLVEAGAEFDYPEALEQAINAKKQ